MQDMELNLESESELELEGLLGESEDEYEFDVAQLGEASYFGEPESEDESILGEYEGFADGEQFNWNALKKLGGGAFGFLNKALPIAQKIAPVIAPYLKKVVAGPLGGILGNISKGAGTVATDAGDVGNIADILLGGGDGEFDTGFESEAEFEAVMEGPLTEQQALGEFMAATAAQAAIDTEAEAQMGASFVMSLTAQELAALRKVVPSMTRGIAWLTRILRQNPATRPLVAAGPIIAKRAVITLKKQSAAGKPVTKLAAANALAAQTKKVLSTPHICAKAVKRNVKATRAIQNRIRTAPARPFAD